MLIEHAKIRWLQEAIDEYSKKAEAAKERAAALALLVKELFGMIIQLDMRLNQVEERLGIVTRPAPPPPATQSQRDGR
jgi:hypothetical protein